MAMRSLRGLVAGPDDLPIPNARVELPSIQLATSTDTKGRFLFSAVPVEPRTKQFRIQAKSWERLIALELPKREDELLTIYFDVLEESHA